MNAASLAAQGPPMRFVCVFTASLLWVGAAAAQAPIEYAGRGAATANTASLETRLAGGADASYGYSARNDETEDAVIDLRRSAGASTRSGPTQPAAESGAQAWLERERVGPPYEANGRWYVPTPEPGYEQVGEGSWYGPTFHGRQTASGEVYDQEALTAAHPTLPLQSLVQVTNLENGREVIVRINDRGPFVGERLIDLSRAAAAVLGYEHAGHARVHVRYLGPAPRRVNADGRSEPTRAAVLAPSSGAGVSTDGPVSLVPATETLLGSDAPQPPVHPLTATPAGQYVVQVGAFSDPANAQRIRAAVEDAGPAEVDVRRTASGAELFRVRVGPWTNRADAEAARATLASLGYPEAVVAQR